jgi:hypothetical protein
MAEPPQKVKVTWLMRDDLYEEARQAVLLLSEVKGPRSLSALMEQALEEKLKKLRTRYNRGRPFPRRRAPLLSGRPPRRR